MKRWVPGNLTCCEDDFASLVWPFRGTILSEKFYPAMKNSCPRAKNVNESPSRGFIQH